MKYATVCGSEESELLFLSNPHKIQVLSLLSQALAVSQVTLFSQEASFWLRTCLVAGCFQPMQKALHGAQHYKAEVEVEELSHLTHYALLLLTLPT